MRRLASLVISTLRKHRYYDCSASSTTEPIALLFKMVRLHVLVVKADRDIDHQMRTTRREE